MPKHDAQSPWQVWRPSRLLLRRSLSLAEGSWFVMEMACKPPIGRWLESREPARTAGLRRSRKLKYENIMISGAFLSGIKALGRLWLLCFGDASSLWAMGVATSPLTLHRCGRHRPKLICFSSAAPSLRQPAHQPCIHGTSRTGYDSGPYRSLHCGPVLVAYAIDSLKLRNGRARWSISSILTRLHNCPMRQCKRAASELKWRTPF